MEKFPLAINANYACHKYGTTEKRTLSEAVKLCRDAGFRYLDINPVTGTAGWEDACRRLREELESLGMTAEQTHAPFGRYGNADPAEFAVLIKNMITATALVGAKYCVIHADEYKCGDKPYTSEDAVAYTKEYMTPLVDYASSLGVTMAFENLFEDGYKTRPGERSRCCSTVDELLATLELFNGYKVGVCWDFGHAHVAFGANDFMELAKVADRLVCTHVHDNDRTKDQHLLPYLGNTDWTAQMKVLRDADYTGKLSLELVYGRYPDSLMPHFLAYARRTAETLNEDR